MKKKVKWLFEEAYQITDKRREVKGKGEKKRYTHQNADFQRIARRDKNTRACYLPSEKLVCRPRSHSYNQTWKNGLVQNWEKSTSRLSVVTLLI